MTTQYWLNTATHYLQSRSITTARLDCLVLLEDTLRVNRAQLLAEPTTPITDPQVAHLQKLLTRRAAHEPLAYIRGFCEFYGRRFSVSPAVLTPRPESETMIELLLELPIFENLNTPKNQAVGLTPQPNKIIKIADVGAGSGCLGITAAIEIPETRVDLLEIDPAAAKIAQINVDKLTTRARVVLSDLLDKSSQYYDVLLCNLPYVPDDYEINKAATFEPRLALFAGPDGLDLYRKMFDQLSTVQKRPLFFLIEAFPAQHSTLAALAAQNGYKCITTTDFIQVYELLDAHNRSSG